MDMYNADGSRGKMCGNGIRCVAKYVYDQGIVSKKMLRIETLSGIKETLLLSEGEVRVNMGIPKVERMREEVLRMKYSEENELLRIHSNREIPIESFIYMNFRR